MAKKIKLYERLLFATALAIDGLADVFKTGMLMYKKAYWEGWLPEGYRRQRGFYDTMSQLYQTGYLEKIIKDGKPYLRLTSKANEKLKRDFSYVQMQHKKWDQKWRLVVFDIDEKARYHRQLLREKLLELGFAQLQRSIYISPHDFNQDIYEYLKQQKLLGQALVLTANHEMMGDPKHFASQVWGLDKLVKKYNDLWLKVLKYKKEKPDLQKLRSINNQYLQIIQKDPCLPYELLPVDWIGDKVKKTIVKL